MLIWMKTCLCKQACNTLSHLDQRMAELWRNKVVCKIYIEYYSFSCIIKAAETM